MARSGSILGGGVLSRNCRVTGWAGHVLAFAGFLAVSICAFALPARAENETFTRAGSLAVVRGFSGLEMRDAANRPVAPSELARGIRSGVRAESERAASLSKLPGLRALFAYLDRLDELAPKLRTPGRERGQAAFAIATFDPKPPKLLSFAVRVSALPSRTTSAVALNPLQFSLTPGRVRVLPLLL